jgi:hypothetical protein
MKKIIKFLKELVEYEPYLFHTIPVNRNCIKDD